MSATALTGPRDAGAAGVVSSGDGERDGPREAASGRHRGWVLRRALAAADLGGLVLAFALADLLVPARHAGHVESSAEALAFLVGLPLWVVAAKVAGLYDRDEERTNHTTVDDLVGIFQLVTLGVWLLFAGCRLTHVADPNVDRLVVFWALAVVSVASSRAFARALCRRRPSYVQNTVIVGAGDVGQLVARKLIGHPEYGVEVVGFVDSEPKERWPDLRHLPQLGTPADLPAIVERLDVERVVVAFLRDSHEELLELIRSLFGREIQIDIVPRYFDVVGPRSGMHTVEGLSVVSLPPPRLSPSSRAVKRAMDVALSLGALVLLAPLLGLIALLIKRGSPGPVLFRQVRVGACERTFEILKFRTMTADAERRKGEVAHLNQHACAGGDPRMFKAPADPRVTRIGRFLRRWSLDELPQLVNVLRGEMSLVGPRPLILEEHRHVEGWAKRRLDLKPGITGLWQALGRSEIPFEEMVHLDYRYVTGWSLLTDLKLVLRTVPAVLRERHAY